MNKIIQFPRVSIAAASMRLLGFRRVALCSHEAVCGRKIPAKFWIEDVGYTDEVDPPLWAGDSYADAVAVAQRLFDQGHEVIDLTVERLPVKDDGYDEEGRF